AVPEERISDKVRLVRLPSAASGYRSKEAMHAEVASFAENLVAWIGAQERAPDVIHAHYADAAAVAAIVEARLGIPFVFTAHSLGRVKAAMLGGDAAGAPALAGRIATEEAALAQATLVIASSRDEAEVQYAGYESYNPGRVRVVPPGSDLARFAAAEPHPRVDALIDRFLD
ncbi:glycosyltransferase, partial [Pseudomonas paraglycinae]|uniref:glycosyltransferase n=1 Tax=Pseudomonas paraglycinae TaxID=2892330 RepID=UPI003FD5FD5A